MAVLSIDGLAESMTQLVIIPEDSDEDKDQMPFSVRSLSLSPSTRLGLFMEEDLFIPAFNNRFEVAISENQESGDIEFIGSCRSVSRCLLAMEKLKEEKGEFVVKKIEIERDVHGKLTGKRNKRLMEIMESHDVFILHDAFPISFPTEVTAASIDAERLEKALEEIEMMGKIEGDKEVEVESKEEEKVQELVKENVEGSLEKKEKNVEDKEDGEKSVWSVAPSSGSKEGSIMGLITSTVSSVFNQIFRDSNGVNQLDH